MPITDRLPWLQSALLYFIIAALLGVLLRVAFVIELPEWIKYKNIQHAHSHVAMMGWLSAAFYLFICHYFQLHRKIYRLLFWSSQATVLGMLISFPIQGYALFSILFSSLFMLISYAFIYNIWKEVGQQSSPIKLNSVRFLKSALFFMALSTIGIWAMGPIMSSGLRGTAWYYASVQFFLHFQFNGWYVFALLALMFRVFEREGVSFRQGLVNTFFWLLVISCFLTYALAVTWSTPDQFLFWANSIGVLLQGVALIYFLMMLRSIGAEKRRQFNNGLRFLWAIAFFCLSFKILIQTLVAIPALAIMSYTMRNFVIGFIHLLMLGALSTFIFGLLRDLKWSWHSWAIPIFLLGFILTEGLLFGQGVLIWLGFGFMPIYYEAIAIASVFLPAGIIWLLGTLKNKDL